jgi:nucleoside-diphosphate-sugar epimerase
MNRRRVLVTGLSGLVGAAVRPALAERYELSSLTRHGVGDLPLEQDFRADVSNLVAIQPAFAGVDTVVHLAATGGVRSERGSETPWEDLLRTNIVGTYNVFEASARAGAKRVVFASSGATVRGYETTSPYRELAAGDFTKVPAHWPRLTPECEPRPTGLYGVSKLFGEDLARFYAETTSLSVLCLRLGSVSGGNRPETARHFPVYLSHRDLAEVVVRAIEAPADLKFEIFFVTSRNRWGYRDLSKARAKLGYEPQDSADDFREGGAQ